jgi:dipeptidyl aminopeptidase/acylaminoacyl peptidase
MMSFTESVGNAGAELEIHTYPGDGHLFSDPDSPDHDPESARLMLERALTFLERV